MELPQICPYPSKLAGGVPAPNQTTLRGLTVNQCSVSVDMFIGMSRVQSFKYRIWFLVLDSSEGIRVYGMFFQSICRNFAVTKCNPCLERCRYCLYCSVLQKLINVLLITYLYLHQVEINFQVTTAIVMYSVTVQNTEEL